MNTKTLNTKTLNAKKLQDLAHDLSDRVPEVASTGLEHVRRGGRMVAERAPAALSHKPSRSALTARRGLPAIAAAVAVLALLKILRGRRSNTPQDEPTSAAAPNRDTMPSYTRVGAPRSGESSDATASARKN